MTMVQVLFLDQKCLDCWEEGDRRLMSQYCHMQKCRKHPGKLQRIHPGGNNGLSLHIDHIIAIMFVTE